MMIMISGKQENDSDYNDDSGVSDYRLAPSIHVLRTSVRRLFVEEYS